MNYPVSHLARDAFPPLLHEIPDPPETLTLRGSLPSPDLALLAVVGSRKYTTYGAQVVDHLISGLRGYPIGIVSGLALGIDSLAHRAALKHDLYTLAIPGSGLDERVLYPRAHVSLAHDILAAGGGLLSEFDPQFSATHWSFPRRNRIVTGCARATLIIEATEQSGTLISARLTVDYNRELMVVPGNIFSANSAGCHQFLKLGAIPVTEAADILETLGIDPDVAPVTSHTYTASEQRVIDALAAPIDRDTLIRTLNLPTAEASALLMEMEMNGYLVHEHGQYRRA